MEVIYARCAGLDVHKKTVVACWMHTQANGHKEQEIRRFGTTTGELQELLAWLQEKGCSHVAIESTGVYWKPVYNVLEDHGEVMLVNARHVKQVPGRKTDVSDAEWLADLLRHGLLRASFIPPREQRDLRDLTRQRSKLVAERAAVVNRVQKVLEDANIKLASVATDVMGVSGRAMLRELIQGQTDPAALAELARGRLRNKRQTLEQALIERMSAAPATVTPEPGSDEARSTAQQEPLTYAQAVELLDTIPGVNRWLAEVIVAEMGIDMSRFPSARHLASWSGLAPGNNESAGKRRSGKTPPGNQALRKGLVQAAHGASRTKNSYLKARYHRIAARRGKKRATVAVAHSILVSAYHMLLRREPYHELGDNYFDEKKREFVARHLLRRLEKMGYQVAIEAQPDTFATVT
jgi:transposase